MSEEPPERSSEAGVFLPGFEAPPFEPVVRKLSLQEIHEVRLLLRGDSVVDWHRLGLTSHEDVLRLLSVNGIDVHNPRDRTRLDTLRAEAVRYITESLGLRLDESIASTVPATELPLIASSSEGRAQRHACTLLKVMHIIYHLDARELRMALSIPDSELFSRVEQSIVRMFDELRTLGVPVVEFAWSRKSKESLITKLLVKRETNAARVFDRLRFRLVVEREQDILPTLHLMLRRFIPFNYVVPGQTVNRLVDDRPIEQLLARSRDFSVAPSDTDTDATRNEFSSQGYQVLNFVADLPVRVDGLVSPPLDPDAPNVVFVLAEFQIIDHARAKGNEVGENSHDQYKTRQHQRVRERLLREPRKTNDDRG